MGAGPEIDSLADELTVLSAQFEAAPASKVIRWAVDRFSGNVALACSFQDCVIVDVAVSVDPSMEILFLDTGYHFAETLSFVDEVKRRYGLNLRVVKPGPNAEPWPCGTDRCCELRKVVPLNEVLSGRQAWLTGLKRVDAATRSDAPIVSWDPARNIVKVNPLATWSDDDIDNYIRDHELPVHPLISQGYLSIGCAPTTRPVQPGEDPRAGRWSGSGKTECGLHG